MGIFKVSIWSLLWSYLVLQVAGEPCQQQIDKFTRRLGQTRFYIIHGNSRGGYHSFYEARAQCEQRNLKLATVPNMRTMAVLGRQLEKVVTENKLKDTWYWLDAFYDEKQERYLWNPAFVGRRIVPVKYNVMLYRQPRPTGVGSHVNYNGHYQLNNKEPQCLTLAVPWPGNWEVEKRGTVYGHQTILDEKPCISKKGRHVICESQNNNCRYYDDNPFVLTEGKTDYFEDGLWIFGNRKYLVNWRHRTFEESQRFCRSYGLEVFSPTKEEKALIPFLKMWTREVTVSQFWTSLKYVPAKETFDSPDGSTVFHNKGHANFTEGNQVGKRSNKLDKNFCVAMSHSYELREQIYCPDGVKKFTKQGLSTCPWSFIDYIPANCNNYLGTICQHKNKNDRKIEWKADYVKNVTNALIETALTQEFGYAGNIDFLRSKYKQTFGILYCPKGYRMLRNTTEDWEQKPNGLDEDKIYKYDYKETYWVVDEQDFHKDSNSSCLISIPGTLSNGTSDGYYREIKSVMCSEWHFYICERLTVRNEPLDFKGQPIQQMKWAPGPQPRKYPLFLPVNAKRSG